ncbi:hypothetical protein [Paenibacillus sp. URB8-2]|uniref:hypothetical protein n=1 Tax=Paenibacillus sp. URB8-2 TaxID=2741301 RepID=UPI0015C21FDA|nr:hypothetical protein [Paenibacillus sp. URB8-2]BCG58445.1 hypothetical protein PUR_18700 [Paenibacillus sp. URB8-2]
MIKQAVKVSLLFMLAFILSAQPLLAAGKAAKFKVTYVSAELVENEHVGNEWWWGGYVNGKELEEGSSVTVSATGSIKLRAEAQEQDKYPEDGFDTVTVKLSSLKSSINKTLNVTVTENRGRYSGNTATWRFVFKIEKL